MPPAAAAALCSRVTTTSVIMRDSPPAYGSPAGCPAAPSSPISAVGTARVPNLSLRRCSRRPGAGATPSAAYRGTTNGARVRLPGAAPSGRASATAISASAAEQNHFSPVSRQASSVPVGGRALVVEREMSDPPCDSVIHCPLVIACAGSVDTSLGNQASRTDGSTSSRDSNAAAPSLIATGQENTADSGPYRCSSACCTTRAVGPNVAVAAFT